MGNSLMISLNKIRQMSAPKILCVSGGQNSMTLLGVLVSTNTPFRVIHLNNHPYFNQVNSIVEGVSLRYSLNFSNDLSVGDNEIVILGQNSGPFRVGRIYRPYFDTPSSQIQDLSNKLGIIYMV